jgi:hypothetical protein
MDHLMDDRRIALLTHELGDHDLAERLVHARREVVRVVPDHVARRQLASMLALSAETSTEMRVAAPIASHAPRPRPASMVVQSAKLAVAAGVAALMVTGGMAVTGSLPSVAQELVADAVSLVGVDLPRHSTPAPARPPGEVPGGADSTPDRVEPSPGQQRGTGTPGADRRDETPGTDRRHRDPGADRAQPGRQRTEDAPATGGGARSDRVPAAPTPQRGDGGATDRRGAESAPPPVTRPEPSRSSTPQSPSATDRRSAETPDDPSISEPDDPGTPRRHPTGPERARIPEPQPSEPARVPERTGDVEHPERGPNDRGVDGPARG